MPIRARLLSLLLMPVIACDSGLDEGPELPVAERESRDEELTRSPVLSSRSPALIERKVHGEVDLYVRSVRPFHPKAGVIVLHGGPGVSHDHLQVLEKLSIDRGFEVVNFDQRGTGRSSAPSSEEGYGLTRYLADIEAIRVESGWDRVHFLGHSWGGFLALAYAVEYPQRVESLALIDSAAPAWDIKANSMDERVTELRRLHLLPDTFPEKGEDCTAWLRAWIPVLNADPQHVAPTALRGSTCRETPRKLTWRALGRFDLRPALGRIASPVLVLYGEEDPFGQHYVGAVAEYAYRMSVPVTEVAIPECGHRPMHECPEPFFDALNRFYTSLETSSVTANTPIRAQRVPIQAPDSPNDGLECVSVVALEHAKDVWVASTLVDIARVANLSPFEVWIGDRDAEAFEKSASTVQRTLHAVPTECWSPPRVGGGERRRAAVEVPTAESSDAQGTGTARRRRRADSP